MRAAGRRTERASFQFHGPVRVVEELSPASVSLVSKMDVDEGIVLGLDRFLDERHAGLLRHASAFPDVARGAGTHDVFPRGLTTQGPRDDVVERQLAGREALAALLASVFVAGKDIPAIEFDFASGQAVVKQQPNDPRHGDVKVNRRDPVMPIRLEITPELTDLAPALEIVVGIPALFE